MEREEVLSNLEWFQLDPINYCGKHNSLDYGGSNGISGQWDLIHTPKNSDEWT
jgi:hypothetical protein